MFSRNYGRVGKDINCHLKLESDIYNPVFEEKIEFREPNLPATSTLLLKVRLRDPHKVAFMVVSLTMTFERSRLCSLICLKPPYYSSRCDLQKVEVR